MLIRYPARYFFISYQEKKSKIFFWWPKKTPYLEPAFRQVLICLEVEKWKNTSIISSRILLSYHIWINTFKDLLLVTLTKEKTHSLDRVSRQVLICLEVEKGRERRNKSFLIDVTANMGTTNILYQVNIPSNFVVDAYMIFFLKKFGFTPKYINDLDFFNCNKNLLYKHFRPLLKKHDFYTLLESTLVYSLINNYDLYSTCWRVWFIICSKTSLICQHYIKKNWFTKKKYQLCTTYWRVRFVYNLMDKHDLCTP